MLVTYDNFIRRVGELGFYPFSRQFHPGFPSLEAETDPHCWHTGDFDSDPWKWKDRAAEERKLAFGCLLGGHKGFIGKDMYRLFHAVYHPIDDIREIYSDGILPRTVVQLYELFESGSVLSTSDIRKLLSRDKGIPVSKIDAGIIELQTRFFITVCGNKRKISLDGLEYGWPSNTYCRVEDWAPPGWIDCQQDIDRNEARELILDAGCATGNGIDRNTLKKILFGKFGGNL
ncbi:MAG: hypothetical protein HGA22_08145 [Clostridiales bacterium]|nr:hypothetical protein [Clostridiales bacterium]